MNNTNGAVDFEKFKLETSLEEETVKELYQGFLEEILEEKDKLLLQYAAGEYDRLSRTVHNIKGISSSYMTAAVYKRSMELDARLKDKNTEEIGTVVNMLVNDIIEAAGEIISYCRL